MKVPYTLVAVAVDKKLGFRGNISAVVSLSEPLEEQTLQRIANDLNQPATTFLWEEKEKMRVRWFAPDAEIGLCGHGSLAAFSVLNQEQELSSSIDTIKGKPLSDNRVEIELSAIPVEKKLEVPSVLTEGLGVEVLEYYETKNKNIVVVKNENVLRKMKPNFQKLRESETFGYTVTTKGDEVDFVSRTLVPHVQQLEDHATGSSHAVLAPFWSKRLNKELLNSWQLSPRGGAFELSIPGDKLRLTCTNSILGKGEIEV
ncbi:PhzF family phenazine biosynthesis protein [Salibacter halophilus]|uniref:PhzF family phenazine biosynthesis protein n=1 Tax=Salibacter halophilus TaxID=1803916 RepID=A0A6N6M4Y1_9FLAO|nr:PhzF family phenazine biosynthesis protein [Salibacter halophilus]KAB1064531.1 PhzF family phenazine biosynthesis protein [Salibacter halophilus]